jgi:hypothetical protein
MLNPKTMGVVVEIVNLFAKHDLPIIARERIFDDVRLVMDSRTVEPINSINPANLDELRRENIICQSCYRNQYGKK